MLSLRYLGLAGCLWCLGSAAVAAETEFERAIGALAATPKYFHGLHDLVIEGDAASILLVEVYSEDPATSSLYLLPSSEALAGMASTPIRLCGESFGIQVEPDALTIDVPGCGKDTLHYRVNAGGVGMIGGD